MYSCQPLCFKWCCSHFTCYTCRITQHTFPVMSNCHKSERLITCLSTGYKRFVYKRFVGPLPQRVVAPEGVRDSPAYDSDRPTTPFELPWFTGPPRACDENCRLFSKARNLCGPRGPIVRGVSVLPAPLEGRGGTGGGDFDFRRAAPGGRVSDFRGLQPYSRWRGFANRPLGRPRTLEATDARSSRTEASLPTTRRVFGPPVG